MFKILSFGEIIWDVFPTKKCIGGAPLNFSAHAVKHGAMTYLVSAVGKDELGKEAICKIKELGVNTNFIDVIDKPTGACNVVLDDDGVPKYDLLKNVAYDSINEELIEGEFDAIYFGTLAQRSTRNRANIKKILERTKINEVFCDVNIRPPFFDKESVGLCCKSATILKISDEEMPVVAELLFDEQMFDVSSFQKRLALEFSNLKIILITAGSVGSYAYKTETEESFFCPAIKTKVVSTVGAGDSYSATFLIEYLNGSDVLKCMEKASEVSARVVAQEGAI